MAMLRVMRLLAVVHSASAGRLHLVTTKRAGYVDPGTGETQLDPLVLPKTQSPTCRWTFLNGTVGQVSASFYQNSSLFIVAQQTCDADSAIVSTNLLSMFAAGLEWRVADRAQATQP